MNKAPIAAAMLVAICTASVLFAYAEPAPRSAGTAVRALGR